MRACRIGVNVGSRSAACRSRSATGSRSVGGDQSAWASRGVIRRAATPVAARSEVDCGAAGVADMIGDDTADLPAAQRRGGG